MSGAIPATVLAMFNAQQIAPYVCTEYRYRLDRYATEVAGIALHGIFREIAIQISISILHQSQRVAIETGQPVPHEPDLPDWDGKPIVNIFVCQGGHGLGKSVLFAVATLWMFHCHPQIVGSVYGPTKKMVNGLTWRYVDEFLRGKYSLRAPIYTRTIADARCGGATQPAMMFSESRGIGTTATNNSVTVQGGHAPVVFHFIEEAEGVSDQAVIDSILSIVGKGSTIGLLLMVGNPASSTSPFARISGPNVRRDVLSCLDAPNVVEGRIVVPGAVDREWIEAKIKDGDSSAEGWAGWVDGPNPERGHFQLPWLPGKWIRPYSAWHWRVLGVPPPEDTGDALISLQMLRAASKLPHHQADATHATLGVDSAYGGKDSGRIARLWRGTIDVLATIRDKEPAAYLAAVERELEALHVGGCRSVVVNYDDGGGYGAWARNLPFTAIARKFQSFRCDAFNFNGTSPDPETCKDAGTWAYMCVHRRLKEGVSFQNLTPLIEKELCDRRAGWTYSMCGSKRVYVRQLEEKKAYKARNGSSPDTGDAVALACIDAKRMTSQAMVLL